ncbi:hypothetical protein [Methylocapsa palsarum]|uniref:Uncharacterized protein n=1 Tax=Methylocapsa palsarum TaxID=1612308 RepID=A0A1I4CX79_9HYPH|nr:hypothetical protein [Methylocapsa palsarum]SFK85393.1 hypothetical protein SAMN05444581_13019 [Methylocapsa palsarum]
MVPFYDKNAIFVESVEKQRGRGIEVIDPTDVKLVGDSSSGHVDAPLNLDAALRKSAPTGTVPQVKFRVYTHRLSLIFRITHHLLHEYWRN